MHLLEAAEQDSEHEPIANIDVEAQTQDFVRHTTSIYKTIIDALKRPLRATLIATTTVSVISIAIPQVGLALWAAAPAYHLGAACACFAAAFALTYAPDWVQLGAAGAVVGAALTVAFGAGPMGLRLIGGAVAGGLAANAARRLYQHSPFVVLCLGVLVGLVALDRSTQKADDRTGSARI